MLPCNWWKIFLWGALHYVRNIEEEEVMDGEGQRVWFIVIRVRGKQLTMKSRKIGPEPS
jgi:hypothetical protein